MEEVGRGEAQMLRASSERWSTGPEASFEKRPPGAAVAQTAQIKQRSKMRTSLAGPNLLTSLPSSFRWARGYVWIELRNLSLAEIEAIE
jgi:hypothetical protein